MTVEYLHYNSSQDSDSATLFYGCKDNIHVLNNDVRLLVSSSPPSRASFKESGKKDICQYTASHYFAICNCVCVSVQLEEKHQSGKNSADAHVKNDLKVSICVLV